jgi:hypothetical protein
MTDVCDVAPDKWFTTVFRPNWKVIPCVPRWLESRDKKAVISDL